MGPQRPPPLCPPGPTQARWPAPPPGWGLAASRPWPDTPELEIWDAAPGRRRRLPAVPAPVQSLRSAAAASGAINGERLRIAGGDAPGAPPRRQRPARGGPAQRDPAQHPCCRKRRQAAWPEARDPGPSCGSAARPWPSAPLPPSAPRGSALPPGDSPPRNEQPCPAVPWPPPSPQRCGSVGTMRSQPTRASGGCPSTHWGPGVGRWSERGSAAPGAAGVGSQGALRSPAPPGSPPGHQCDCRPLPPRPWGWAWATGPSPPQPLVAWVPAQVPAAGQRGLGPQAGSTPLTVVCIPTPGPQRVLAPQPTAHSHRRLQSRPGRSSPGAGCAGHVSGVFVPGPCPCRVLSPRPLSGAGAPPEELRDGGDPWK